MVAGKFLDDFLSQASVNEHHVTSRKPMGNLIYHFSVKNGMIVTFLTLKTVLAFIRRMRFCC
jgi:hypothetical protein